MIKAMVYTTILLFSINCVTLGNYYVKDKSAPKIPLTISSRIGDSLDADESKKYDLFTDIVGFREARFYFHSQQGYEMEIITDTVTYIAINDGPYATEMLSEYIDNYEKISESSYDYMTKWGIVDFDDIGQPITKMEVNRVKSNLWWIAGGLGCGVVSGVAAISCLSLAAAFVLFSLIFLGSNGSGAIGVALAGGGCAIGCGISLGSIAGREIAENQAIKTIKKIRKPKIIY